MKAAFITQTGPTHVIQYGDLPEPAIGPNDVLVRTRAVALNPIDTYIRAGNVKFNLPSPWIIGCDVAGVVEAIGSAVTGFRVGDRVWGSNQSLFGRQGTFAELCSIHEQWLYSIPPDVTDDSAAAGALVGITAHLGLFLHGGLTAGEVVFVNGGTGGVGSAVTQLASAAGATVITTVGSPEKSQLARASGASHVIEYKSQDVDERLQSITRETGPVKLWFETLRTPTLERCIPLMAMRGRLIFMAGRDARPVFPLGPFYVKDLRAIGFAMFNASPDEQRVAALSLNGSAAAGSFRPMIGMHFPLSASAEAHRVQEGSTIHCEGQLTGKIVLHPE